MSNKFRRALQYVLQNEGGDSNVPQDRGGRTRFGITEKTAKRHGFNVHTLTREQAEWIYMKGFWEYEWVSDERVAIKWFDLAVNMGNERANRLVQEAANDCGMCLALDGVIGPKTRLAVNALQPQALLEKIVARAKDRYAEIIASDSTQKVFQNGWMARADRLPEVLG